MTQRYFIKLSYKGSNYHGWQSQRRVATVQDTLKEALQILLKEEISLTGAGRTDTGVHAREFYAHFDSEYDNYFFISQNIVYKLNCILPKDIAIDSILHVKNRAHARFDALSRTYEYIIEMQKNPFTQKLAYFYGGKLDLDAIRLATNLLFSYSDFTSFSKSNTQVNNNICEIKQAIWYEENSRLIFTITANRFLRNMVRAIVGTLIEVGEGKLTPDEFARVIESKDRRNAGYSVPGCGLYLAAIKYPDHIFLKK